MILLKSFYFIIIFYLAGCSSNPKSGEKETDAERFYNKALENIEDERYLSAIENLSKVKDEFPYSRFAVVSILKMADVYFLQEDFDAAFAQYTVYRDLYPTSDKIEYVIYRQAESLYNSLPPTIDRDLANAPKAIKYYEEVRQKFPKGEYSKLAGEGIQKTRGKLLEKEDYIGNFYFIRKHWSQAFNRYDGLRKQFPESRLDDKALYRMIVSLQKENKDADMYISELKKLHPNSSFVEDLD